MCKVKKKQLACTGFFKVFLSVLLITIFPSEVAGETKSLNHSHDDFVVCSAAKSGTNLLTTLLDLLIKKRHLNIERNRFKEADNFLKKYGRKPYLDEWLRIFKKRGTYDKFFPLVHMAPSFKNYRHTLSKNVKIIAMVRDPRDRLLSLVYYCRKKMGEVDLDKELVQKDLYQLAKGFWPYKIMKGDWFDILGYSNLYRYNDPKCKIIKFEELIGLKGGGSEGIQKKTIREIALHIGIQLTENEIMFIVNNMFGKGPTFRKGKVGLWKQFFTEEIKEVFKKKYGNSVILLGYEVDDTW